MLKTDITMLLIIKMLKKYLIQFFLEKMLRNLNFKSGNKIIGSFKKRSIKALLLSTIGKVIGNAIQSKLSKEILEP